MPEEFKTKFLTSMAFHQTGDDKWDLSITLEDIESAEDLMFRFELLAKRKWIDHHRLWNGKKDVPR